MKGDFAVCAAHQECRKRPPFLGNEAVQQIGPARGQKLQHLLALDGALQDDAP